MPHNVFISHSSQDKDIAAAICHYLEEAGIRCWVSFRDIDKSDWAGNIISALQICDVFVVILSGNSAISPEVLKEVAEGTRVCQYILPFRVDDEMLPPRLQYHLASCHWLDAINPPLEAHIKELIARIEHLGDEDNFFLNTNRRQLVGHTISPKSVFLGRDHEIEEIHCLLQEEPILFLQGMGGIGKSEIAKGYAKAHTADYDTVLFLGYRGSLLDAVIGDELKIENVNRRSGYGEDAESAEEYFNRKLQALRELSNARTLLIVDNFDVDDDPYLSDLAAGPFKLLITTRNEHFDYPCLPVGPIENFDTVRKLFARNYGRTIGAKDVPIVDEILRLVRCHTITVELIAKQMRASHILPAKMLERLQSGGADTGLKESVQFGQSKKTAFDFISDLFSFSDLTEEETYLLQCMCLVPYTGIDAGLFMEYMALESFDPINALTAKSWLMLDEESDTLQMHPIICDVVKSRLHPNQETCKDYIMGLWTDIKDAWWMTEEERSTKWPYLEHILTHYGDPTPELLAQYTDFANVAWICSRFPQSIAAAKRVYQYTLDNIGSEGFAPAYAARAIAGAYYNAGDEAGAEPYYYLALEHMLKRPDEAYKELGVIYQKVGRCCYTAGDYAKGEAYLHASLEAYEKARANGEPMEPVSGTDTYICFGRMYMLMGEYEKALPYAEQSYDRLFAWENQENTSSGYCLRDMGICHSMLGNYEKAADYLQRAIDLNTRFNGEASMITAQAREAYADNLVRMGKINEAKAAYQTLELDIEKYFGPTCAHVARLQKTREAL